MDWRNRSLILKRSIDWIKSHKYKAFYYLMEADDLESGARALFQVCSFNSRFEFWDSLWFFKKKLVLEEIFNL